MIAGIRDRFAIEAEVDERFDDMVCGHIRFWLNGLAVGNWADFAHLTACANWLQEFVDNRRDRYEPGLWALPPREVFRLVYDPVMRSGVSGRVRDPYARFFISHLGMSSFERFDLLLLKDGNGSERCVWREGDDGDIHDCYLRPNEMEDVAREFLERFGSELRISR